jgi:hypothetical protein
MSVETTTQNSPYAYPNAVSGSSTGTAPGTLSEATNKPGQHCPSPHAEVGRPGTPDPTRRGTGTRREARGEEW